MINLLPQQQKKTLRQELRLRLVLILSISIVSFFLSLIFLLGANWIYLGGLVYSYRSEVMSSQEKVLGADEETSKEVKAVNRTLSAGSRRRLRTLISTDQQSLPRHDNTSGH